MLMIQAGYKQRAQYKQRAKWTSKNRFCCPFGLEKCLWTIFKAIWLCAFLLKFCLYSSPAQGPGVVAESANAGGVWGGQSPPTPILGALGSNNGLKRP